VKCKKEGKKISEFEMLERKSISEFFNSLIEVWNYAKFLCLKKHKQIFRHQDDEVQKVFFVNQLSIERSVRSLKNLHF